MYIFFAGLEYVGHSFAYVAHFVFLRDVWIRTQCAAVASRRATNLATHFPNLASHIPNLASHLPNLDTHLPDLAAHLPNLATHLPVTFTFLYRFTLTRFTMMLSFLYTLNRSKKSLNFRYDEVTKCSLNISKCTILL